MATFARRGAAAAIVLACVAAGCGGAASPIHHPPAPPAHFEPAVQATFLRACKGTAGSARSVAERCRCVLANLEARVSQKTLQDTERALARGEAKVPEWMISAASACNHTF
jgi:hypothetical protein